MLKSRTKLFEAHFAETDTDIRLIHPFSVVLIRPIEFYGQRTGKSGFRVPGIRAGMMGAFRDGDLQ